MVSGDLTAAILAEIHRAIQKLGGNSQPMTPADAARTVREFGADVDLRGIADSWSGHTLDDDMILEMVRNWNAGKGVFARYTHGATSTSRRSIAP